MTHEFKIRVYRFPINYAYQVFHTFYSNLSIATLMLGYPQTAMIGLFRVYNSFAYRVIHRYAVPQLWLWSAKLEAIFCCIGMKLKNIRNFSDSRINRKQIGENFGEAVDDNPMLNHYLNLTFSHDMHFNTMLRKLGMQN